MRGRARSTSSPPLRRPRRCRTGGRNSSRQASRRHSSPRFSIRPAPWVVGPAHWPGIAAGSPSSAVVHDLSARTATRRRLARLHGASSRHYRRQWRRAGAGPGAAATRTRTPSALRPRRPQQGCDQASGRQSATGGAPRSAYAPAVLCEALADQRRRRGSRHSPRQHRSRAQAGALRQRPRTHHGHARPAAP
jgi:transposase-like protein